MVSQVFQRPVLRKQSARQIHSVLKLNIWIRRVQHILPKTPHIHYAKQRLTIKIPNPHKKQQQWAREQIQWNTVSWKYIIFTDEKV